MVVSTGTGLPSLLSSNGPCATGGLFNDTLTVVTHWPVAPQASVTVKVIVLSPSTGVKQTVSPLSVPILTSRETILLSTSLEVNPGRQICADSHINMVVSSWQDTSGALLRVTIISVVH